MGVSPLWSMLSHVVVAAWVCDGGAHVAQDWALFERIASTYGRPSLGRIR